MKSLSIKALAFFALLLPAVLKAQQVPLNSQYMFNRLLINPAYAGTSERIELRGMNRNQWVGLKGAPTTYVFSANGSLNARPVGLGGYISKDETGPVSQLAILTCYSYRLRLTQRTFLSMGLEGGVFQYKVDPSKLTTDEQNDQTIDNIGSASKLLPDAGFGVYAYHDRYYAGISMQHMLGGRLDLANYAVQKTGHLYRHVSLIAGGQFTLNQALSFEPSIAARIVSPTPVVFDFNAKILYQNSVWMGLTYRTQDAVVLLLGFKAGRVHMGYAYDLTTSSINKYSKGSHEIMLGFDLGSAATLRKW